MKMQPSRLVLQNGQVFEGISPSWQKKSSFGEVVFSTGMTGYVESLTDPSYAGQILVFTFPLIGNYGVPTTSSWESHKIHAQGVVINDLCEHPSHYDIVHTFASWLEEQKVPLITQIDTRALTKSLRTEGSTLGAISYSDKKIQTYEDPNLRHLVAEVSCKKPIFYGKGKKKIIAVDCGMKENILRCLLRYPVEIKRVPFDYDYTHEPYDGIFLSNGPGDPSLCKETVAILKKALGQKKPIFGICLGAQILALSIGAKTHKLLYGHRGHNQPVIDTQTQRCYLTSQNHGYAVVEKTLPKEWRVSLRNLNDGSVEGIAHRKLPFFAVQFHPEAAPGPTDTMKLFDQFYQLVNKA